MKIGDLWTELEKEAIADSSGYLSRRILVDSGLDLQIAVEKPSNKRLLLFRVKTKSLDTSTKLPACIGFELQRISLPNDELKRTTLQLGITETRFSDVFTEVVQNVLNRIVLGKTEQESVSLLIARLQHWQAFFKKHSSEGLDEEEQRGLFGELCFLRTLLANKVLDRNLNCWTGPLSANQDFQFKTCSLEVKATTSAQGQRLSISSERQLDKTGTGGLFVLHHSLDSRIGDGESLNDIVRELRHLLEAQPALREEFDSLLVVAGYLNCHAELYELKQYTHREINYFEVRDQFPRIVESELRTGVGNVKYSINVSECMNYRISEEEVLTRIKASHG